MKTTIRQSLLTATLFITVFATAQKPTIGGGKTSTGSTTTTTTTTSPAPTTTTTGSGKGSMGSGTTSTATNSTLAGISNLDAASAIKEALSKGVMAGVNKVSVTDGYFKNQLIKILLPAEVKQVESSMRQIGMGSTIDKLIQSMNRAAEGAAKQAGPIFLNSIKQMTINDALKIVGNQQPDAATQFLQNTATESLVTAFRPSIKSALDKTMTTKLWTEVTTRYNKIPFVRKINTDLTDHVTRAAIKGLFVMVAQEEAKIRKDPGGQASSIIDKVFGAIKL